MDSRQTAFPRDRWETVEVSGGFLGVCWEGSGRLRESGRGAAGKQVVFGSYIVGRLDRLE